MQHVGAIKLDKEFLYRILAKDYFNEILNKISIFCPKIIAEGGGQDISWIKLKISTCGGARILLPIGKV